MFTRARFAANMAGKYPICDFPERAKLLDISRDETEYGRQVHIEDGKGIQIAARMFAQDGRNYAAEF